MKTKNERQYFKKHFVNMNLINVHSQRNYSKDHLLACELGANAHLQRHQAFSEYRWQRMTQWVDPYQFNRVLVVLLFIWPHRKKSDHEKSSGLRGQSIRLSLKLHRFGNVASKEFRTIKLERPTRRALPLQVPQTNNWP